MLFGRTSGESGLNLDMYLSKMARLIKTRSDLEMYLKNVAVLQNADSSSTPRECIARC